MYCLLPDLEPRNPVTSLLIIFLNSVSPPQRYLSYLSPVNIFYSFLLYLIDRSSTFGVDRAGGQSMNLPNYLECKPDAFVEQKIYQTLGKLKKNFFNFKLSYSIN